MAASVISLIRGSPHVKLSPSSFICNSCLARRTRALTASSSFRPRFFSALPSSRTSHPPSSGYAALPSRRLLSLAGPDSSHFLQGVITANLSPTSIGRTSGLYAAFLNAQGRILNDVFIYPRPSPDGTEGWLIEVDANEAEKLYKHVKRYKLRAKFDVRLLDADEMGVWSVWKESNSSGGWTAHTIGEDMAAKSDEIWCTDSRAPGMGRRVLLPASRKPEAADSFEEVAEETYTVRRYLRGVAEGQSEIIRETALPQETNLDYMGGVDYRKGCYVGQELTIRTHHTGVVRKRILPVMLYGKDEEMPKYLEYRPESAMELPPQSTGIGRVEKKGRSAGKWLTGIGNIGLGLCRLEIMTDAVVQGEGGGYKEGDEFKIEWEAGDGPATVKVKAFVPSWHLTR